MTNKFPEASVVGFLVWFRNEYGIETNDTFFKMADKFGQCNYVSCRAKILRLVELGFIHMTKISYKSRKYQLNLEKYNELVNALIPQTDIANQ